MSESPHHHHYDADIAIHDADGNIKLRVEPEDHLDRLLAPDTEVPWYKSIIENVRELIQPEKLPPLELRLPGRSPLKTFGAKEQIPSG